MDVAVEDKWTHLDGSSIANNDFWSTFWVDADPNLNQPNGGSGQNCAVINSRSFRLPNKTQDKSCTNVFRDEMLCYKKEIRKIQNVIGVAKRIIGDYLLEKDGSFKTIQDLDQASTGDVVKTLRQGRENIRDVQRDDFELKRDAKGLRYGRVKVVRQTKNHRGDDFTDVDDKDGRMYEIPGSANCPVRSFTKYFSKLHPDRIDFWQRPKLASKTTESADSATSSNGELSEKRVKTQDTTTSICDNGFDLLSNDVEFDQILQDISSYESNQTNIQNIVPTSCSSTVVNCLKWNSASDQLYREHCYWFTTKPSSMTSWTIVDAMNKCRDDGGYLAPLIDDQNYQFIKDDVLSTVFSLKSTRAWLGTHSIMGSPTNWNNDPAFVTLLSSISSAERCVVIDSSQMQSWIPCNTNSSTLTGAVCFKQGLAGDVPLISPEPITCEPEISSVNVNSTTVEELKRILFVDPEHTNVLSFLRLIQLICDKYVIRYSYCIVFESQLTSSNTSILAYKLTKISVYEDRPVAKAIGGVGVAVLVSVLLFVVLLDCQRMEQCISNKKTNAATNM
ncbi:unnamed protein product [Mytilus coruscus]|uniref:C-type lectin domain-containing protein n=1 Tax=Mytilus coruscus TaxID=42192 RepID=A0A6J8EZ91_MYTCO|nr:unnamed protein product [Mytilus coruscus]